MGYFKEVTVKLQNDEQTYVKKIACYNDNVVLNPHDITILSWIEEAKKDFKGQIDECSIRIKMEI